jgi:ubiquinol-cytochrome c reductase cytochrome c1 subunit
MRTDRLTAGALPMIRLLAWLFAALAFSAAARAAETGAPLDPFPADRTTEVSSLQNGAKLFANYCLTCHAASYMRYNRMHDIGLTDEQIRSNLIFASQTKVGDLMKVAIDPKDAKDWFGTVPPDLTLVARSRAGERGSGADYLYTYLRSFYRDPTRPTGWNNVVYPNVAMPHVLWQLQGIQAPLYDDVKSEDGKVEHVIKGLKLETPGSMNADEFNANVADLVAYLQWLSEPAQRERVRLGVWVLMFLALFWVVAWRLNAAYWKDVK